jgi:hypothetical protein
LQKVNIKLRLLAAIGQLWLRADMTLYPSESELAVLVLGKRAKDWPRVASYLEDKHGLPRIDELMGGRYWPAVAAFFRQRNNMDLIDGIVRRAVSSRIRIVPPPPGAK